MATAIGSDEAACIKRLSEMFSTIEGAVIRMVAEDCRFNITDACRVLYDMTQANKGNKSPTEEACIRIVNFIRKGYKVLVLMRGLPGSGKTSLARMLLKDGHGPVNPDEFIFSTDDYFARSGGYIYNPKELEEAHTWNQRRAFSNAKKGVSPIIIDNTNLEIWEMKVYCIMGVQFGYIIELLEVQTPWALNPKVLATKNSHGVDKRKIQWMLERYQQGVVLQQLMREFGLSYTVQLPQFREYPPPSVPFQPPNLPAPPSGAKKKQPPVEYVHKFENRRKGKGESRTKTDVDQILSIDKTDNINKNLDLISFMNELKPTVKTEESVQPAQTELLAKQLEEHKEMLNNIMLLMSEKKVQPPSSVDGALTADDKMEVDQPADSQISESSSESKPLDALLMENKQLQELLSLAQKSSILKGSNPFAPLMKPASEKDILKSNRLQMYFDRMDTPKEDAPSQPKKTSPPSFDRKAWGLTEDALVSWDQNSSPHFEFQGRDEDATCVEVCEQSTITAAEDIKDPHQKAPGIFLAKSLYSRESSVRKVDKSSPPKRMMLDKGCMTDEAELLLEINMDEKDQMKELMELFPDVPPECLLDVYEKCQKDFHWTADVISSSPTLYTTTSVTEQQGQSNRGHSEGSQEVESKKNLGEEPQKSGEEKLVLKQTVSKQGSTTKPELKVSTTTAKFPETQIDDSSSLMDTPVNLPSLILQPFNNKVTDDEEDRLQKTQMRQHHSLSDVNDVNKGSQIIDSCELKDNSPMQTKVCPQPIPVQIDATRLIAIENFCKSMSQLYSSIQNSSSTNTEKSKGSTETPQSSPSFSLQDWTVVQPSPSDNPQDVVAEGAPKQEAKEKEEKNQDEEAERLKREEEEADQLKKQEEEAKQLKKQEELLELKKQLEKTVTIGKEHYSDHVWQIKNSKSESSVSNNTDQQSDSNLGVTERRSETPDLMILTDDTIYVSEDSSDEDNESVEEDIVELTLGDDLVEQLEGMFGQLSLGDNLKPVVQIPESMARQLHAAYLESLCRQIENQSDYISRQMKEDEEFAMKLQEAERHSVYGNTMNEIIDEEMARNLHQKDVEQQWKDMTPDTLAQKLTKQKLYAAFPGIDNKLLEELLVAHDNDYRQTVESIINSANPDVATLGNGENVMDPPISETTLKEMKMQAGAVTKATGDDEEKQTDGKLKTARVYREEANAHMLKREELQRLAQNYYQKRAYAVSMFYTELAQKELKKADLANQHAVHCFVRENSEKFKDSGTLDLHFLNADAALISLDIFIDFQISELKKRNKTHQSYSVITGWGKRSKNGRPVLKPVVMRRLKQRNITFTAVNPGMLKIKIHKNLLMTTDIRKKMPK